MFNDNFESGSGNWSFGFVTGYNAWMLSDSAYWWTDYATSGVRNIYADDYYASSGSYSVMNNYVTIPANAWLHFNHAYDFYVKTSKNYAGGVVEYSTDNGSTWHDTDGLFSNSGYTGTISTGLGNSLQGRSAFVGTSHGYGSSRINLSSLAGQNVKFRFMLGTGSSANTNYSWGWWIDDVQVYTCACAPKPVTIGGTTSYYTTISGAYTAVTNGKSVMMQASEFSADLNLGKDIYAFLKGGYGCDFISNPGWTTISGSVTINRGTVIIENVIIK
jgi:hypothetical protein